MDNELKQVIKEVNQHYKQPVSNAKLLGGITGKGFIKGKSGNPLGRKKESPEVKAKRKVLKEFVKEYTEKLAKALPKLNKVLIQKAKEGDMMAIKEINDRVMGKPQQRTDITSGGNPIPILGGASVSTEPETDKPQEEEKKP